MGATKIMNQQQNQRFRMDNSRSHLEVGGGALNAITGAKKITLNSAVVETQNICLYCTETS